MQQDQREENRGVDFLHMLDNSDAIVISEKFTPFPKYKIGGSDQVVGVARHECDRCICG